MLILEGPLFQLSRSDTNLMKRFLLHSCLLVGFNLSNLPAHAQTLHRLRTPVSVVASLDYDTFFGFYPSVSVNRPLDSLITITGYGIFYTDPAFFGVEVGLRLSVTPPRRSWSVTPGLGVVSGSVFVEGRSFAIAEGYTGSLAIEYEESHWFAEGYMGYYGARKRLTTDTYDFGFYSIRAGRVISQKLRIGLIYARLGYVRLPRNRTDTNELNLSRFGIGATVNLPISFTLQMAGGLTAGADKPTFFQLGLSRRLSIP